jgi:hypothetical protein
MIAITEILIMIASSVTSFQPVHATSAANIEITNLQVSPSLVKVGDEFAINATLVNNSTDTITVHNGCGGAFVTVFDNHATVGLKKVCNELAAQIILKPGDIIPVTSLASNLAYNASSAGNVNANVTVTYSSANQSLTASDTSSTVSKSFLFTIYENNQTNSKPVTISSPLEQLRSGITANNIQCRQDLELIFKATDDSPACVKPSTVIKLVMWGWARSTENANADQSAPTIKTITLDDNDKSIYIKKGERFLVKLGSNFIWNIQIDNQTVASRVINIMVVKDAQGVYEVHNAGNATITGVGDPLCRTSTPPCEIHSVLFRANVIIP